MILKPAIDEVTITSSSPLIVDWGDGVVDHLADSVEDSVWFVAVNKYTHTYTSRTGSTRIKVRNVNLAEKIEFLGISGVEEIVQWYEGGYAAHSVNNEAAFSGLGAELLKVPSIEPPNTNDYRCMFLESANFNSDISNWNTTGVLYTSQQFDGAASFNYPLPWDLSLVTDFRYMLRGTTSFNQDLPWDIGNATNIVGILMYASSFNGDISNWNPENVTRTGMSNFIYGATSFNGDLSQWCVPLVATAPNNFAVMSALAPEHYPVWGTCPRGENLI